LGVDAPLSRQVRVWAARWIQSPAPPMVAVQPPRPRANRRAPDRPAQPWGWPIWLALGLLFGLGYGVTFRLLNLDLMGGWGGTPGFRSQGFPGTSLEDLRRSKGGGQGELRADLEALALKRRQEEQRQQQAKRKQQLEAQAQQSAERRQRAEEQRRRDALERPAPEPAPAPEPEPPAFSAPPLPEPPAEPRPPQPQPLPELEPAPAPVTTPDGLQP